MNSSVNSRPPDPLPVPLLVRDAGVAYALLPLPDPFETWIELMEVVEALCAHWPPGHPSSARPGSRCSRSRRRGQKQESESNFQISPRETWLK